MGGRFIGENAWEEIETWVLAGLKLPKRLRWKTVRAEVNVKEVYFEPLVRKLGLTDKLGGGRKELAQKAAGQIQRIRTRCPEDFDSLAIRIESFVQD